MFQSAWVIYYYFFLIVGLDSGTPGEGFWMCRVAEGQPQASQARGYAKARPPGSRQEMKAAWIPERQQATGRMPSGGT